MKKLFVICLSVILLGCIKNKEHAVIVPTLKLKPSIDTTRVDFSLTLRDSLQYRVLTFIKHRDSSVYFHMKYTCNCGDDPKFSDEVQLIEDLWSYAEGSIDINLRSVDIVYPLIFSDILKKHIATFDKSTQWKSHLDQNGKTLNYALIRETMLLRGVYAELDSMLNHKGYHITRFSTEKHGYVVAEKLKEHGYSGTEIIPMPFIVVAVVKSNN